MEEAGDLARMVRRPDQRWQGAHIVSGVDDRFSRAKPQLPHKGTTFIGKRASVVPIGTLRIVTIAVAAHIGY